MPPMISYQLHRHGSSMVGRKDGRLMKNLMLTLLIAFCVWHFVRLSRPPSFNPDRLDPPRTASRKAALEPFVDIDRNITTYLNNLRHDFETACNHSETASMDPTNITRLLQQHLQAFFTPPSQVEKLEEGKDPVKPCRFTFLDLGSNIGDSLGKFIDAAFPSQCQGLELVKGRPRYSVDQGTVGLGHSEENDLTNFVKRCFKELSHLPEEYCFVGVEGNPVFKTRLQELEARVMGTTPRPVRSVHFYTETVAAGVDGPTVLFVDTVNAGVNFWGSSIVATHRDAKASAAQNNNVTVKAPVMGLTLSTLLERSVRKEPGAHVVVKLDIEGGEYPVMNAAIDALCNFTSAGVRVDLILETHGLHIMGEETPEMKLFFSKTQQSLKDCNVRQGDLSGVNGQR